jgi:hypothetical protein
MGFPANSHFWQDGIDDWLLNVVALLVSQSCRWSSVPYRGQVKGVVRKSRFPFHDGAALNSNGVQRCFFCHHFLVSRACSIASHKEPQVAMSLIGSLPLDS